MKRALITLALLLAPINAYALPEIGKPAPDFTAKAADGATVKPSDYKGRMEQPRLPVREKTL
jgi:hypothetical protein